MTAMNITRAYPVFIGAAQNAARNAERAGAELATPVIESIVPIVADADGISVSQSVGAGADATITGLQAVAGVAILDVPRNVVGAWTTDSVVTVYGTDVYGQAMSEVFASGATLTGTKAFKTVTRITSSAAITAATFGTGTKLGLKYRPVVGGFVRGRLNEDSADAGTYVAPSRVTATTSTVDVRGTYAYAGTANGTNVFTVIYFVKPGPNDEDLFGVTQA